MGLIAISSITTLEHPDPDASELAVDWVAWLLEKVALVSAVDTAVSYSSTLNSSYANFKFCGIR